MSNKMVLKLADAIEDALKAISREHEPEGADLVTALTSVLLGTTLALSVEGRELHALIGVSANMQNMISKYMMNVHDAETEAADSQKH